MLELQAAVEVMDAAIDDKDAFIEADIEFHLALARATQNPLIAPILDPFLDLLSIQRYETFEIRDGARRGQIYHKKILEAILHKDSSAAENAMKEHLYQVRTDTAVALNEQKEIRLNNLQGRVDRSNDQETDKLGVLDHSRRIC